MGHSCRAGGDLAGGERMGCFGELHPVLLRNFGLEQPVVGLEIELGELEL